MSQKYKSFSRGNGRNSTCSLSFPPGVKRMGYLRKLKKMKRRFFVLHVESDYGIARLEYYSSEKKWKFGCEPRRCIELKSCLNISHKLHSKHKNVIALYTQDDCFSVVAESAEELELWLNDLLEVQRTFIEVDENARWRPIYEHLWQVEIDKHDIEDERLSVGPYRVALSSKSLFLIKMNSVNENDYFEFPLMSIRRCGHSKDHFFVELGRSSVIGAGEIYMATEGTIIAQNMHETVLSAMKSSKIREDGNPLPRPRSASTSDGSSTVVTRRPIAPQTVSSSISSCGLSNSRERCDSLPNRSQTGNTHNCVLSALSSPYASSGTTFRKLSSRPHSMYEWPSCNNSPSARNASFSPSSLSSATACSSSTEDIDKMKLSLSYSYTNDGKQSAVCGIAEKSDEYLKMSLADELSRNDVARKRTNEILVRIPDYMDMKSSSVPKSEPVSKLGNCLSAPNHSVSDNIAIKDGYLDMSPNNSLPKDVSNISSFRKEVNESVDYKGVSNQEKHFELEKVLSLLKIEEGVQSTLNYATNNRPAMIINEKNDSSGSPTSLTSNPDANSAILGAKPPLPEKTYHKTDNRSNVGPPLPIRKGELLTQVAPRSKSSDTCRTSKLASMDLQNKEDLSLDFSNKYSELDDQDVFYNTSHKIKQKSMISPGQNTNFSCLNTCERSNSHSLLPCAPICSATKAPCSFKQNVPLGRTQNDVNKVSFSPKGGTKTLSSSQDTCDNLEVQCSADASVPAHFQSKSYGDPTLSGDPNSDIPTAFDKQSDVSGGDYVNIDFNTSSPPSHQIKTSPFVSKATPLLLPPCSDSNDPSYSNIQFGKPFCPTPKPVPANPANDWPFSFPNYHKPEGQKASSDSPKCAVVSPMPRNIPNTLPAFRKQMSAPAGPLGLRPELPSPGRKSSCPVTASASMIRPPMPGTSACPVPPVCPSLHGTPGVHLKVSTSRSPDHSSVSSISSASDEISSAHSSPKTLTSTQNFRQVVVDGQYENVIIPQRSSTSSRPPSTSSEEKELNYAMLDLGPPTTEDVPRSPTIRKTMVPDSEETSTYAEIDFTKSEGLKNTSGSLREGRL